MFYMVYILRILVAGGAAGILLCSCTSRKLVAVECGGVVCLDTVTDGSIGVDTAFMSNEDLVDSLNKYNHMYVE